MAGRPAGRPGGARVVRGEEKKTWEVRGAAAPQLNPSRWGSWGGKAAPAKIRRVWGVAPPSHNLNPGCKLSPRTSIYLINFSQPFGGATSNLTSKSFWHQYSFQIHGLCMTKMFNGLSLCLYTVMPVFVPGVFFKIFRNCFQTIFGFG